MHTGKDSQFWNTCAGQDMSFFKDILSCLYWVIAVLIALYVV